MANIFNVEMVETTILHHLNSQECAWAFLRIKDLFFQKGPMPLQQQHENALWKKEWEKARDDKKCCTA